MSQQAHQNPQSPVIDGSVHPELIPDLTAYRLWFVSVSRGPISTDAEMKHQAAQLNRALLGAQDQKIVIGILATFKTQYLSLIASYNAEATAAWAKGGSPNAADFMLQRDQIVQSTYDALKANLSASGWALLDAHLNAEKHFMRLSQREDGQ
ncbi:MAG TPA: hypothetical protein VK574_01170 [Terracidiphilus sp.]|nr:hypothetical protein [Terracidiphilus sp.]